jgi:acetyltransferase-like isoleucine patch superfamily enzyme
MDTREITGTWAYSTLPANVEVGRDCYLERRSSFSRFRSVRTPGLRLGDRVRVYTWTVFNVEPDGLVEIGDDSVIVGGVFMSAGRITVGRRVVVSYQVTIADCDFHPIDPAERRSDAIASAPSGDPRRRPPLVARPVVIEDDAWIGIGAIILKGVTIGARARVGPGAIVTRSVAAGATVTGNPARVVADSEVAT